MRTHLSNAAYGVLDYVAWPVGMLVVAPTALRHLGSGPFGVWMVANAYLSIGSIVGVWIRRRKHRFACRKPEDQETMQLLCVRCAAPWAFTSLLVRPSPARVGLLAPFAAAHIASADVGLRVVCLWALRIASILMLARAAETVCVSTQRAFERYDIAIGASLIARLLALASAAVLPLVGVGVIGIMAATAIFLAVALAIQLLQLDDACLDQLRSRPLSIRETLQDSPSASASSPGFKPSRASLSRRPTGYSSESIWARQPSQPMRYACSSHNLFLWRRGIRPALSLPCTFPRAQRRLLSCAFVAASFLHSVQICW